MTNEEFEIHFEQVDLYDDYMDYIMEHSKGERVIANGEDLLSAFEERYLYEEYRDSYLRRGYGVFSKVK